MKQKKQNWQTGNRGQQWNRGKRVNRGHRGNGGKQGHPKTTATWESTTHICTIIISNASSQRAIQNQEHIIWIPWQKDPPRTRIWGQKTVRKGSWNLFLSIWMGLGTSWEGSWMPWFSLGVIWASSSRFWDPLGDLGGSFNEQNWLKVSVMWVTKGMLQMSENHDTYLTFGGV